MMGWFLVFNKIQRPITSCFPVHALRKPVFTYWNPRRDNPGSMLSVLLHLKKKSHEWQRSTKQDVASLVCVQCVETKGVCVSQWENQRKKPPQRWPPATELMSVWRHSTSTNSGWEEKGWVDGISPCHPFPPLCCIERNPFSRFSSESLRPGRPKKWPSWKSWRWRTSESRRERVHNDCKYTTRKKNKTNHKILQEIAIVAVEVH